VNDPNRAIGRFARGEAESEQICPGGMTQSEFERFYRLYFLPLVRRTVRRHRLQFEDAGDIVQDAFVLAVARLDPSRNPKAWLYQVVDNLAANFHRKVNRRSRLSARWIVGSSTGLNVGQRPDD
jgi:DNA-directed RNA polymerase specialized sigma24 family protein